MRPRAVIASDEMASADAYLDLARNRATDRDFNSR
jgi:hypothetical protein